MSYFLRTLPGSTVRPDAIYLRCDASEGPHVGDIISLSVAGTEEWFRVLERRIYTRLSASESGVCYLSDVNKGVLTIQHTLDNTWRAIT